MDDYKPEEFYEAHPEWVGKYILVGGEKHLNGWLNEGYRCRVNAGGNTYSSAFQYFAAMYAKYYGDQNAFNKIMLCDTAKSVRRKMKDVRRAHKEDWKEVETKYMKLACRAKFDTNPELKQKLLETGEAWIAVLAAFSRWAIRAEDLKEGEYTPENCPGRNILGEILMELREEYRTGMMEEIQEPEFYKQEEPEEHTGMFEEEDSETSVVEEPERKKLQIPPLESFVNPRDGKLHIYTHTGKFDLDDLLGIGMLKVICEKKQIPASVHFGHDYVKDMEGVFINSLNISDPEHGKFVHNMEFGPTKRLKINGEEVRTARSTLTQVWSAFAKNMFTIRVFNQFRQDCLNSIEMEINGLRCDCTSALTAYFPEEEHLDDAAYTESCFIRGIEAAERLLNERMDGAISTQEAYDAAVALSQSEECRNSGLLILDKYTSGISRIIRNAPWVKLYVTCHLRKGKWLNYCVNAVKNGKDSLRMPLIPLPEADYQETLFASFSSKEEAVQAARKVIAYYREQNS